MSNLTKKEGVISMGVVVVEQEKNGVTWIRINREKIRNAINLDVMDELNDALHIAEKDESRIVVLTGAGDQAFCSGGDLSVFQSLKTSEEAYKMLMKMGAVLEKILFFPKVTVAALNGTAVGGGCELSVACDFRVAAPHVKMGFVQGKLGITTGWGGGTILLQRISQAHAMEMMLSAKIYPANSLINLGIIQEIISGPFQEGVLNWLKPYLNQNAGVLQAYKARLLDSFDQLTIQNNIKREIEECSLLWATDEHHEAVNRFLTRSK
ncbi:enoyl-CoA hydratase/isomerase family protein [Halalkalibacter alkalisediminis]|uniref:Ethylmalonyl-CoA decarboxylase n=1 Tax=Halalkalibacter alkalisediminis TaxID=935616 RepID=A0ABV6ND73_9BACI|nr:enoyl-CoA hydratase/isomerase family protein [Halalkalibacter alkalisediminis]